MKITIIQTGEVPEPLRPQFGDYPAMFERMFDATDNGFSYDHVTVGDSGVLPDPSGLEAIAITGSPAGVYDDLPWIEPLRDFIRAAYEAGTPMVGICFGHQIMADALGGDVRKSEKGWGLGRHSYSVAQRPGFMADAPGTLAVACSHQDQVITAPESAEVILSTPFTPNAGLYYRSGKALSFQPHPEFPEDYARALLEWRRGRIADEQVDKALSSFDIQSNSDLLRTYIGRFLKTAGASGV